jgi:hypothetical protein
MYEMKVTEPAQATYRLSPPLSLWTDFPGDRGMIIRSGLGHARGNEDAERAARGRCAKRK